MSYLGQPHTLFGGGGDDSINGGAGADSLDGGADIDTLDYTGSDAGVDVDLGSNTVTGGDATGDTIANFENIIGSGFADRLTGSSIENTINGGNGRDTLYGGGGKDKLLGGQNGDSLFGGGGNDKVFGGSGSDILFGGARNDTIKGGGGKDVITGGKGNDVMSGNGGADDFIFISGFGEDIITDFDATNNKEDIDLSGVTQIKGWNDLKNNHMEQVDDDVIITQGVNTITLEGVDIDDLGKGDFIF